jgi:hypothetical protein
MNNNKRDLFGVFVTDHNNPPPVVPLSKTTPSIDKQDLFGVFVN